MKIYLANNKCGICNATSDLHVHHKTYENIGKESDEDLIVLCKSCHYKFHTKLAKEV